MEPLGSETESKETSIRPLILYRSVPKLDLRRKKHTNRQGNLVKATIFLADSEPIESKISVRRDRRVDRQLSRVDVINGPLVAAGRAFTNRRVQEGDLLTSKQKPFWGSLKREVAEKSNSALGLFLDSFLEPRILPVFGNFLGRWS